MKIDPYHYPLIIIIAFIIGMFLAMAFGFLPQHGSGERKGHGVILQTQVQTVDSGVPNYS